MNSLTHFRRRAGGFLLAVYKHAISPFLHSISRTVSGPSAGCRFHPTCSEYASAAWSLHGPWRGGGLALWRVLRCHPLARGGFDPVPNIRTGAESGVPPRKSNAI